MVDQVIDNYEDATGVESTIIAVNNDLIATGTNSDWQNQTVRTVIPASSFASNQTTIQIKFCAGASSYASHTFLNTFIGHASSGGNAWDFESTPTRVTWAGGSNATTIAAGVSLASDVITFNLDASKDLIFAIDTGAPSNSGLHAKTLGSGSGFATYNKAGSPPADAATVAPSGYGSNTANRIWGVDQIIFPGKITRVHGTSLAWS